MTLKQLREALASIDLPDDTPVYVYVEQLKKHYPECDATGRYGVEVTVCDRNCPLWPTPEQTWVPAHEVHLDTVILADSCNDGGNDDLDD